MAAELKPCPFCGGNATVNAQFGREWWVECDDCAASTGGAEASREAAVATWNRRVSVLGDVPLQQVEPRGDDERLLSGSQELHEHANVLPELSIGEVGVGNMNDGLQQGQAEFDVHASHGTPNGVMVDAATARQINVPDAGAMPSICEGMEKPGLWAYAHLCGYRAALTSTVGAHDGAPAAETKQAGNDGR